MAEITEQRIREIFKEEIEKSQQEAQYSVARVPVHTHNNIDAPNVPAPNVTGFLPLSAVDGGVLDPDNLETRTAFWEQVTLDGGQTNTGNRALIPVFPVPIISGDKGEEAFDFAGGDAPDGTLLLYKGGDYWQLWGMFFGSWKGITLPFSPGVVGPSDTFTTADAKTVTVTNGIITDIT